MIHQQNKDGGIVVYNWEDFFGLVPSYGFANYNRMGKGASHQNAINVFRDLGILEPGFISTNFDSTTSNIAAQLNGGVVDRASSQPNVWLIEKGAKIHQIAGSAGGVGSTIRTTVPFPFTILSGTDSGGGGVDHSGHTTPVGEDIIIANIDGTDYILYSYNDNTDGDVGQVPLAPAVATDFIENYFTRQAGIGNVLNKNYPHPMIQGDYSFYYIADGQKLKYIAPDGTTSVNSTIVPEGFAIKAFSKTGTHLILFCNKLKASTSTDSPRGESIAVFWNYRSQRADFIKLLNDNKVVAGFNFQGIIGCFTVGRLNDFNNLSYTSKLQVFIDNEFKSVFNFSEVPSSYNCWDIHNNHLIWYAQGTIFDFGKIAEEEEWKVNKIGSSIGRAEDAGMCKSLNGYSLFLSSGTGTSGGLEFYGTPSSGSPTFDPNAQWRGMVLEPLFPMGMKGKIDMVEVGFFSTLSTGKLKMDLLLDTDYGTQTTIIDDLDTITSGKQIVYKKLNSSGATLPDFNVLKPIINWVGGSAATDAPKVNYLKIYYSLIPIVI